MNDGRRAVMKRLRRAAAKKFYESDVAQLGILAELFGWVEEGTLCVQSCNGAADL